MLDSPIAGNSPTTRIYYSGAKNGVLMGSFFGNSGGPLAVRDATGTWIQAGLFTGGDAPCGNAAPDYGPKPAAYDAWIKENMGGSVAVDPMADPRNRLALHSGGPRLAHWQRLTVTIWDLSGSQVWSRSGRFDAGAHVLPRVRTGAVVGIRGEGFQFEQRLAPAGL